MGTVRTTSAATATAFGNQRREERTSNGVLWVLHTEGVSFIASYSTDGGTTWSAGGGFNGASGSPSWTANASTKMDDDDYWHVAYKDPIDGYIYYRRGTPNAARTAYTWSAATVVASGTVSDYPDVVVCRDPANAGAWVGIVVWSVTGNNTDKVYRNQFTVSSTGTVTFAGQAVVSAVLAAANSNPGYAFVDFNHTGDGKTVKDGAPHWYVGWSAGATGAGYGIRFRKATYSSGSWTWGTEVEVDSTRHIPAAGTDWAVGFFDGTRFVIAGSVTNNSTRDVVIHDVNTSNSAVTQRTILANVTPGATQALFSGGAGYTTAGDIYLFGRDNQGNTGAHLLNSRKWTRAGETLGALVTIESTAPDTTYVSVRRGPQGQAIDYVYTDGTASPYTVTSGRIVLNQNPTAPTPQSPADNATWDSSTDQTVTFKHADPDGDAASAWRIRYRPAGTTVAYAYLTGTTTAANGATITAPVPANTWDGVIEYAEQTYDPSNAEGAWSPTRVITGIPAALAAATGGRGGTSATALALYNQCEAERAVRTAGRSLLGTVTTVSPLTVTLSSGPTVTAKRAAGYTPTAGETVQVELVGDAWVVQDKVV